MKRRIAPLCVAALLGTSLSACGGSSSTSTSTVTVQQAAALSKAQFISQGDAICQSASEEAEPLKEKVHQLEAGITPENESSQLQKVGEAAEESAELVSNEAEQLRSLEPPDSDRKTITRMLALVDSQVLIEEELASASQEVNIEKIKALLEQGKPIKAKAQGIAQGYGFKVCGSASH
jgi:hypothetical protein